MAAFPDALLEPTIMRRRFSEPEGQVAAVATCSATDIRSVSRLLSRLCVAGMALLLGLAELRGAGDVDRFLYVAVPGIRDYLQFGGHGVLVFDIEKEHRFVRRIPTGGVDSQGKPLNVKGICASAATGRLHVSTIRSLICLDLLTDRVLWERTFELGCDRMALSPDGTVMYLPSLEGPLWYVVDATSGDTITTIRPDSGAHNTVFGSDGRRAYLAGLKSPLLTVVDVSRHTSAGTVGPFSNSIRPFTINGKQTRCYVTVNELLGFEIGDLATGKMLSRVEVEGYSQGPVKRHGCPSHGIGLTPDEREIWVCDAHNERLHVFNATQNPPTMIGSIKLRDEPGWVTFSLDGRYAYPSTGDVIDVASRTIVAQLTDENDQEVQSEKLLEIDFQNGRPVQAGDQFGLGRVR